MTFLFSCRLLTTPIYPRRLSSVLSKFSHKKTNFYSGVTSLDGVTRGGPPPSIDATDDDTYAVYNADCRCFTCAFKHWHTASLSVASAACKNLFFFKFHSLLFLHRLAECSNILKLMLKKLVMNVFVSKFVEKS